MGEKFKTKELLKYNSKVQELKDFIDQNIKVDNIPENFIKKHFKDESLIKEIQDAIEAECGQHVYASKIVEYLTKYAAKVIKRKTTMDEEITFEQENDVPVALPGIDYSDHGGDPGYYESKFDEVLG